MTIDLKGKTIELLFGMKAVENYFNRVKLGDKVTAELMVELIWAGIENAYYRERKELDIQFSDAYDFVEEKMLTVEGRDFLNRVYKCFEDSQAVKALTKVESKKKKQNQ